MEADPLVTQSATLVTAGRALDVACGTGRNALYLARNGWDVIAVDINAESIVMLRERSNDVDARVLDLEREPLDFPDGSFDLIAIVRFFQTSLFPTVKRLLRPGGILATSAKMTGRFAAGAGELRRNFEGWEVIHEFEDGVRAELIARKRDVSS